MLLQGTMRLGGVHAREALILHRSRLLSTLDYGFQCEIRFRLLIVAKGNGKVAQAWHDSTKISI